MEETDHEIEILLLYLIFPTSEVVQKPVCPYLGLLVEAPSTRIKSEPTLFYVFTMAFLSRAHSSV